MMVREVSGPKEDPMANVGGTAGDQNSCPIQRIRVFLFVPKKYGNYLRDREKDQEESKWRRKDDLDSSAGSMCRRR